MSAAEKRETVVHATADHGDKSLRVQRELMIDEDGPRDCTTIVLYRQLHTGKWVRDRSICIPRWANAAVRKGLEAAHACDPIVDPRQGSLL